MKQATILHITILWIAVVLLAIALCGTWADHAQVKRELRQEMVNIMMDAYYSGAYSPDHPLYERCRQIERMEQLYQEAKAENARRRLE